MKILLALALVGLCQAGPLENSVPTRLSTPTLTTLNIKDIGIIVLEVFWNPVQSGLWNDPVIGYKVRVWEVPNAISANTDEYTTPDGEYIVKVEKGLEEEESMDITKISESILLEEILTPTDLHRAAFFNVKPGVSYRFRVAAYTKTAQSPYSNFSGITVSPNTRSPAEPSNTISITV